MSFVDYTVDPFDVAVSEEADILRNRLRFLFDMGDAAVWHECWKDTDENLLSEFAWVMAPEMDRHDWPVECRS